MEALITQVTQQLAAIPDVPSGAPLVRPPLDPSTTPIAHLIDHTIVKPEAVTPQIEQLCREASEHHFASVCVSPIFVPLCAQLLANTPVAVCTVVGFPSGASTTACKVFETQEALDHGAREIDMVLAIGRLKAGEWRETAHDLHAVIQASHAAGALVKVIIETALLTEEEKVAACLLAVRTGADFVKTSTGFAGGGATVADIRLMRQVVGPHVGVKASGGIRTLATAQALIEAGADRIGTSAGVAIVAEA
ncbi:MAG: deoxyribose-phosphate aldolase [Chloroflexia bacterium]|nr:deoxyribose-phosphate aldolase [Chloroflexia bacterium]